MCQRRSLFEVVPRLVTVGAAVLVQVNWSALPVEEVPLAVVTVTWTVAAVPAGATATRSVSSERMV